MGVLGIAASSESEPKGAKPGQSMVGAEGTT